MLRYQKKGKFRRCFVISAIFIAAFSMSFVGCGTQSASLNLQGDMAKDQKFEGDFPLEPEFFAGGDGIGEL